MTLELVLSYIINLLSNFINYGFRVVSFGLKQITHSTRNSQPVTRQSHNVMKKSKEYQVAVVTFLKNHWFKLSILLIVVTAFAGKNLNIDFRMNAPAKSDKPTYEEKPEVKPLLHTPTEAPKKIQRTTEADRPIAQENNISKTGLLSVFRKNNNDKLAEDAQLIYASDTQVTAFIERFKKVAVTEMDKFNVPASVTLAQSLLASQAGTSVIAAQTNNYFNLECGTTWNDAHSTFDSTCIRKYETAWFSFRNHSEHLTQGSLQHLTHLDKTDYQRWAKGLELAEYSNDNLYAEKLIRIIEQYELSYLDKQGLAVK